MTEIYRSTITRIGADAQDMIDAGVYILFGEPVPPALADMSVVHDKVPGGRCDLQVGDVLHIGQRAVTLDEVGSIAGKNLDELGHIVLYLNQPGQKLLPGAVKASAEELPAPHAGEFIVITRGQ